MTSDRKAYILVAKSEGKTALGRIKHRWKDNIKMNPREIGMKSMGWINVTVDRDWRRILNEPSGFVKTAEFD
jgi:hypothetical protein